MNPIDQLVKRIEDARVAYYNHQPLMSDAAYDLLEDELRTLDPNNAILKAIGVAPGAGGWSKANHTIPMDSLNKGQVEADMDSWYADCKADKNMVVKTDDTMIIMDKLDGGSLDLIYLNRKLVQAITRGDGKVGEDITRNALLMKGAVKMLPATLPDGNGGQMPTPAKCSVRGEVIVTHADFKQYFQGESNPRNTANGTMKRQSDPAKCAHLTVIAYNLMPNGVSMARKSAELTALHDIGFITPVWSLAPKLSDVYAVYAMYIANTRKNIGYEIDGLVIEFDDTDTRESLGYVNGKPKGSIAYKFPHESKATILRFVRWQVGNSGRLTPVAEFDSVELAKANVKQASLHNISYMRELVTVAQGMGMFPCEGDKILVSRRNDVIPYVEAILVQASGSPVEFRPPTNCPSCSAPVQRDGEYLVCRNEDCGAQASGSIKRWLKKIGVLHFGDSLVETLIEAGFVEDIGDLYKLDPVEVADLEIGGRRVGGTADKAITNLNNKKSMPIHVFVGSLGIPLIGRSMAQTISDAGFNTLSKMLKAKIVDIAAIPGVGQTKAESFVMGFNEKAGLIGKLIGEAGIDISQASGVLLGKTFCFTGFRDNDLSTAIEAAGGTVKDSASKTLTYLVALDKNGSTGKLVAARKNRDEAMKKGLPATEVIDVDDAWALVGGKV